MMVKSKKICLLLVICLVATMLFVPFDIITVSAATTITVYPTEDLTVLKNPGKGFMFYSGDAITDAKASADVWNATSIGYIRCTWSDLEPTEGSYNWALIDNSIAVAASHGSRIGLGVMQKMINSDTSYAQATPLWVFNAGAAYTSTWVQGGTVEIKNPVWDNQTFQNKLNNFIVALKNRYDTNTGLAYIDIRNVGNWGEWNEAPSYTEVQEHINMWNVFTNKQLFMINTTFDSSLWSGAQYALDTYHTGIRRDGCVYPDAPNAHLSLASCYDISPAVAEWWSSYSNLKNSGQWSPIMFERTLREGKPSYMGLAMWDSDTFYAEQKALADRWLNRVGYWFKMTKATYPGDLGNGTTGTVTFRMKNDGVAPIYPNKSNTGYVKLALLDSSNTVLAATTLSGINPFNWKPGQYKDESASFSFTYNANGAKLAIGVFTDNALTNPDVKLGTGNGLANNWYVLSSMSQTEPNDISSNKIYSASSELGETNYGYREARQAFDGKTNTKWMANSSTAGEWLEVDFGENKTLSSANLKENTAAITGYRIEYYNGTAWQTAYTGTTIGTAGTSVSFNAVIGNKARIYVTSDTASPNLDEFTIYSGSAPPLPPTSTDGVLTDELNDFSKTYSHTANLVFDSSNAALFNGDTSRLCRSTPTYENVVYNTSGDMGYFMIDTYFWNSETVVHNKVYTSPDGISYTEIAPAITNMGGDWNRYKYESSSIPIGTRYLKIEFRNTSTNNWNPQISRVVINYAGVLTDELDDFSKTYSHTANLGFDLTNTALFSGDASRLCRSTPTYENVVYNTAVDMSYFMIDTYFWNSEAIVHNKVYTSPDGTNYTEIIPTITNMGGDWNRYKYESSSLPFGTRYLKIEFRNTSTNNWNPQISRVVINYTPAGPINTNLTYKIVNRNSSKALQPSGGSLADGANIVQMPYTGVNEQKWQFIDAGGGYYKIRNVNSGKLMDIYGASTADGANNIQWTDNGGVNQLWQVIDVGGGYYKIKNKNSGKLLDIMSASTADGAQDIQWTDNGGLNQQWQIAAI